MSRAYSNHFHSTGIAALAGTTTYDGTVRLPVGIGHGRMRVKSARATVGTAGMTSGDELRMLRMRSTDRLYRLSWASDGGSTTYAAHLGLYLTGANGDGAVIDADCFATGLALASGSDLADVFAEATTPIKGPDRGKYMWELAVIAGATYTVDPMIDFDIVLTSTATGTTAVETVLLMAEYVAGD